MTLRKKKHLWNFQWRKKQEKVIVITISRKMKKIKNK